MSEVQKPVEEQPVATVEATPVVEPAVETKVEEPVAAPAAPETTAAAEPATDPIEPVAATEASEAPKAATPKKEFTGEGTLGYKAPGGNFLKKVIGFQKKHFWFGEEPVEPTKLTSYLRGEKDAETANHNAAWSSHTGKGLLYFSKHSSEKAAPAGIINLADASDVTTDGTVDFFFHSNGAKHVFQASTPSERDSWVETLKAKFTEAKELAEGVKGSDSYKEHLSSLSKPATVAPVAAVAVAAPKEAETKKEEKAEAKEEKKEEKEEKKARKSRSASRKRNSIFGSFNIGSKKEEPAESKEEKKVEAKETAPVEPAATEPAPLDAPAVAAAVAAAPLGDEHAKTEEVAPVAAEPSRPAGGKRNSSIFSSLSSRFAQKKSVSEPKPVAEAAPAVPSKDDTPSEPVSTEAPVIPAPEASEPLATSLQSPATVPTTEETVTTPEAEEAKPEVKTEAKTESTQKRKSSIFGLVSSKEKTPETDGEKKSPFAKLRQTIKGKSSPKGAEKTPEKTEEPTITEPAEETPAIATETPETTPEPLVVSEPISAAPEPTAQVSAAA